MEVPRSYIDNFTRGINAISEESRQILRDELATYDWTDMTKAINRMVNLMQFVCQVSSESAAKLAAEFYRGMSLIQTGEDFEAEAYSSFDPDGTEVATRGIAQAGVEGQILAMVDELLDRVDFEVKRAAGNTVMENAFNDDRDVRVARIVTDAETCSWCIALASVGYVNVSANTAGQMAHYHPNCDCRLVPVFGDDVVEGYYPEELYDRLMGIEDTLGYESHETMSLEEALDAGKATLSSFDEMKSYVAGATSLDNLRRRMAVVNAEIPYHHLSMTEQAVLRDQLYSMRDRFLKRGRHRRR